ncbi:MAG: delta(1)-pyrroline-2-carboxylate reductase family protein [Thermoflexales bacterium]|nr:delta(1)-pyrroline-2-carboxylate reductase family protein [Thermoflexales bacterium]MDW8350301.1 delta(1)-pyrroline-2-carboxylate reductase family protein [Anaerolineae bacterium]
MRIFDFAITHQLLPYSELAEELRAVLHDKRAGLAAAPQRLALPIGDGGVLLVMPAADQNLAITKLVTVHPRNAERGLPSIHGEVVVMNAHTGEHLMILDGRAVTARRTAALSLLAAQTLASAEAKRGPLLIIGAGVQGKAHLEALGQWLPACDAFIFSRTFADAEALAHHGRMLGINAQAIGTISDMLPTCGIIVTATTSRRPVLVDRVREDALVIAVGAYSHEMAELPAELVRRARVFVDTLEGARAEAGDLIQAGIDWSRVAPLEEAITKAPQAMSDSAPPAPIVFKSVGHALWDLAAARLIVRKTSP